MEPWHSLMASAPHKLHLLQRVWACRSNCEPGTVAGTSYGPRQIGVIVLRTSHRLGRSRTVMGWFCPIQRALHSLNWNGLGPAAAPKPQEPAKGACKKASTRTADQEATHPMQTRASRAGGLRSKGGSRATVTSVTSSDTAGT
jgi:hypothetical protein